MRSAIYLLIFAFCINTAGAVDGNPVVVPVPSDPSTLQKSGFQLFGWVANHWVGSLPKGVALPSGAEILSDYQSGAGDLYHLQLKEPADAEILADQVKILYRDGLDLLIQAQSVQLSSIPPVRSEWVRITTTPKVMICPQTQNTESTDDFPPIIQTIVDSVSQVRYTDNVQTLQDFVNRNTFFPQCDSAAAWILSQFQSFGLNAYLDTFYISNPFYPTNNYKYNVIAEIPGMIYPDSIVVIGAHYDDCIYNGYYYSTEAYGANDNASGTACVLECARILAQYHFKKTIHFVAFGGEEQGLYGSSYYVYDILTQGKGVAGCFNNDMISHSVNTPEYAIVRSNGDLRSQAMADIVVSAANTFIPGIITFIDNTNSNSSGSDHYPFWVAGLPATYSGEYDSDPTYHQLSDTLGNHNMTYATNFTRVQIAALADFAGVLGTGIQVSGPVSGTWTAAVSPYMVIGPLQVPLGDSLIIEPGVIVLFEGHYPLLVMQGAKLVALGEQGNPIIFMATPDSVWAGVRFLDASDSSRLEYCSIQDGEATGPGEDAWGGGIYSYHCSLTLNHAQIFNCRADRGGALACSGGANFVINNVTIGADSANEGDALYCFNSNPILRNSIFWGSIVAAGSSSPQINYCDILGGWSGGVGNINTDPYFNNPECGDFHLQTTVLGQNQNYSPCIDMADPTSPYDSEPEPNGNRMDLGYYGNTDEASLSHSDPLYASENVSGIWTASYNNPMHVISDIYVPAGQTLAIEPGVQVNFLGQYEFQVLDDAALMAVGDEQDSIFFKPTIPTAGWKGIHFISASDSSRLEYCRITQVLTGSGISCDTCSPTIRYCLIDLCKGAPGGGIRCTASSPLIQGNVLVSDSATSGGGIYCSWGNPIIKGNVFAHNSVVSNGGALSLVACGGTVSNNLFYENTAQTGAGAIYTMLSSSAIINCTLVENTSANSAALYCLAVPVAPTIKNTILWGNTPAQVNLIGGTDSTLTWCDIQGGWVGVGNLDVYPQFTDTLTNNYHLLPESPCVDAGNPDVQYNDPEDPTNPQYALWPALGTVRNDMGAYGGQGAMVWVGVSPIETSPSLPAQFSLQQNYPNPFNPATAISYELRAASHVSLRVYDITGRLVTTLVDGWRNAGSHQVTFDRSGLASGIYVYRLEAGSFSAVKKMALLK